MDKSNTNWIVDQKISWWHTLWKILTKFPIVMTKSEIRLIFTSFEPKKGIWKPYFPQKLMLNWVYMYAHTPEDTHSRVHSLPRTLTPELPRAWKQMPVWGCVYAHKGECQTWRKLIFQIPTSLAQWRLSLTLSL